MGDNNSEKHTLTGVFSIIKLSKSGFFTNKRILVINEDALEYYRIPSKTNTPLDNFTKLFEESISKTKEFLGSNTQQNIFDSYFNSLIIEYYKVKTLLCTKEFLKESIPFDEIFHEPVHDKENINKKKFKYCVIIKNKTILSKDNNFNPELYNVLQNKKDKKNNDNIKQNKTVSKEWIVEFGGQNYYDMF